MKEKVNFDRQSCLPPKLRFKATNALNMNLSTTQNFQAMIQSSSDFNTCSIDVEEFQIEHCISKSDYMFHIFTPYETNIRNNEMSLTTNRTKMNGLDYSTKLITICKQLESNLSFVELMIFILKSSNNCSIITFDDNRNIRMKANLDDSIYIQHIHVTMLWKYFINQYGFTESVRRFGHLIKLVLVSFGVD